MVVSKRFPFVSGMGLFDERATLSKLEGYLGRGQPRAPAVEERKNDDVREQEEEDSSDDDGPSPDDEEEYPDEEEYEEDSETVSEMGEELEETQSKLVKTHTPMHQRDDEIHSLQQHLRRKERDLKDTTQEKNILIREVERLTAELDDRDNDDKNKGEAPRRPQLEQRLRKAVEYLKKDLSAVQEKYTASQIEARNYKSKVEYMEEKNQRLTKTIEELHSKNNASTDQVASCQEELSEAREEATKLTEEMVDLRERLRNALKIAEEKESMIEKDISDRVKEKIRLEVRDETTKEVQERTERRIRAEMQLAHDKEINLLRAEFKKVFKENSVLKRKVEDSQAGITKTEKLEHQVSILKDEIERLTLELEGTKEEHEQVIENLETRYRSQIQSIKEHAAKEKWEHATEIRRQISKERDREVQDFTKRIEALSQQTDRLLQRAEREKEEYADQVRQRISQEKQREIQVMMDKLAEITKESEDLLKEAANDKEAYADQIRKQMTEEKNREINKQAYRIEVLVGEKDALLKRIDAFEQELAWTWKEQEKNIEKITSMEGASKASEDEIFKLKRTNQNLVNLVETYKKEHEDATAAFKQSKDHFRKSLLESEESIFSLKDQVQNLKNQVTELQSSRNTLKEELQMTTDALNDARRREHNSCASIPKDNDVASETSSVNTMLSALESERARLKGRRNGLESLKLRRETMKKSGTLVYFASSGIPEDVRVEGKSVEHNSVSSEQLQNAPTENQRLECELESTNRDLQGNESEIVDLRHALAGQEAENVRLTQTVGELSASLDACKKELVKVTGDLDAAVEKSRSIPALEQELHDLRERLENAMEEAQAEVTKHLSESLEYYKQEVDSLRHRLAEANTRLQYCRCTTEADETTVDQSHDYIADDSQNKDCEEDDTIGSNETTRLNNEIKKLKSMINEHKLEFADHRSSEAESNDMKSSATETNEEETIAALELQIETLQKTIDDREAEMLELKSMDKKHRLSIEEMTKKIGDLENLLSSTMETDGELDKIRRENTVLTEKVNELEMLLQEFNRRLSETSEELVESRQEICLGGESISHLKQRVETLTKILEEKDKRISDDENTFEESKKRFDDHVEKAHQEIIRLQSEIEELTFLLNQTRAELQASKEQEKQARAFLQEELAQATDTSHILEMEKQHLEEALVAFEKENEETKKELMDSKHRFDEALSSSQTNVNHLNEEVTRLSEELISVRKQYQEARVKMENFDEELQNALTQSKDEHGQKTMELQQLIASLSAEKDRVSEQYKSLHASFEDATREFEQQKEKNDKEVRRLRSEVAACNEENLEVAKELQHSRQLFREALIAWRVETRELTQQLDVLRGRDQWLSIGSNSKDSFSVQSSLLDTADKSPGQRETMESRIVEKIIENDLEENDSEIEVERDHTDYRAESPGRAQASRFFNSLLEANNEEDEIMAGIYLQESAAQTSTDNVNEKIAREEEECHGDMDDSVNTGGSHSVRTSDSRSTTQRKKAVRWMDNLQGQSPRNMSASRPPISGSRRRLNAKSTPADDRVSETRQECEDRESRDESRGGLLRKDDTRYSGSRPGGSFSTEEGSLRGSNLLPSNESSPSDFPAHSREFQNFRRSQQEHLEPSESRDDTVQSRDSAFFSYTYSSTSNYSSRDFYEYSSHRSVAEASNSQRNATTYGSTSPAHQHSQNQLVPEHDDSTVISGLSASSHTRSHADRRALPSSSPRTWSPRYMELFAQQRPAGDDGSVGRKPRSSDIPLKSMEVSKPLPYDEQKEQVEEERPFDEEQRKLLEQQEEHQQHQQQHGVGVTFAQQDEDSVSISLAETSTLMNSENGSLTVNTDRSPADSGLVTQHSE